MKKNSHDFKVTIDGSLGVDLSVYQDGKVSISGGTPCGSCVEIISGNNTQFIIKDTDGKSNLKIPIVITDDDDIPWEGASTRIQPVTFSITKDVFNEVYIDVVNDGGGLLANNQVNIPFSRNINEEDSLLKDKYSLLPASPYYKKYAIKSSKYKKNSYWVVYILSAWQFTTPLDADPKNEIANLGITIGAKNSFSDCDIALGGYMTALFHESVNDKGGILEETCAHEIGHQFGLTHGNEIGSCAECVKIECVLNKMGIMLQGFPKKPSAKFIPYHKNLIRCRKSSPGS